MKIKTLTLMNFRRFQDFNIDFHKNLTVMIARNSQGKSSILDAASIALGTFISAFDLGKGKGIDARDARFLRSIDSLESEQLYPVVVKATFVDPEMLISRELSGKKNKTTIKDASDISEYGKDLMQQVRDLTEVTLPVIAYYGSGRLWNTHKNMKRKAVLSESRTLGYEDCLSSASSFKQVQQWMAKATFAIVQQQEMPEYNNYKLKEQVEGIKNAVNQMLSKEGWSNFHYSLSYEELAMYHEDHGILPLGLLSDGVRAMVSLAADLAWRCSKLNPHLGADAPSSAPGIISIDEIDMHLHPAWQQRVLSELQTTFPNIQFIVTTHSPQVLSTIHKECIRVLSVNQKCEFIASIPLAHSYGEPSNDVLQAIMHVDPQPPVTEKKDLQRLTSLVDQGAFDTAEARALLSSLKNKLNNQHPQIERIERSIRRQKALQG